MTATPASDETRAEVAALLRRVLEAVARSELDPSRERPARTRDSGTVGMTWPSLVRERDS